jgi:hypothetical protein
MTRTGGTRPADAELWASRVRGDWEGGLPGRECVQRGDGGRSAEEAQEGGAAGSAPALPGHIAHRGDDAMGISALRALARGHAFHSIFSATHETRRHKVPDTVRTDTGDTHLKQCI